MFDYAHYVPALRWKRAERAALKTLGLADNTCDRGARGEAHRQGMTWQSLFNRLPTPGARHRSSSIQA